MSFPCSYPVVNAASLLDDRPPPPPRCTSSPAYVMAGANHVRPMPKKPPPCHAFVGPFLKSRFANWMAAESQKLFNNGGSWSCTIFLKVNKALNNGISDDQGGPMTQWNVAPSCNDWIHGLEATNCNVTVVWRLDRYPIEQLFMLPRGSKMLLLVNVNDNNTCFV